VLHELVDKKQEVQKKEKKTLSLLLVNEFVQHVRCPKL
jgi:hypothetical protein